jgi:hypothetical protein
MGASLPRWSRTALGCGALLAAVWVIAPRCGDVVSPLPEPAPHPRTNPDLHARLDAAAQRLVIEPPTEPPGGGLLRLEVVNLVTDSRTSRVEADVVFRNVAGVPVS